MALERRLQLKPCFLALSLKQQVVDESQGGSFVIRALLQKLSVDRIRLLVLLAISVNLRERKFGVTIGRVATQDGIDLGDGLRIVLFIDENACQLQFHLVVIGKSDKTIQHKTECFFRIVIRQSLLALCDYF